MGPIYDIIQQLARRAPKGTTMQDLGVKGIEKTSVDSVLEIRLSDGQLVRVKAHETLAALRALPKDSSVETVAKTLVSERVS